MMSNARKIFYIAPLLAVLVALGVLMKPEAKPASAALQAEQTLIIDAGHGGADGGAVAADGTIEAEINLDIALRIEALAALCGVQTVMTRESADIHYPPEADTISRMKVADQHARLALINETPNAVLLSIHQNFYTAAKPSGAQVFYGAVSGSETLAAAIQANLTAQLAPENRRLASRISDDVYLMKNASCRAVLVECGFLSNPGELDKLKSEDYRLQLAAVIFGSYLQYTRGVVT